MPLDTEYYEFSAEIERIEEAMQDIAETLGPLDPDNPIVPTLEQQGSQLQSQADGLRWALRTWDVDGVTLAGLTGGEYGHVEDGMGEAGPGKARVYFVAKGTVEAPYVDEEMSLDDRVASASGLHIGYLRWADARVSELMSVEGNDGTRFNDLLVEARQKQTSTDD
ncbi:hypothetical protein ACFR97_10270 [Haloplanus litoreus]|uniref:SCP-2 sterol transfer family protein n=1 Tax=Haloplanus litoreus TaxID=767515 RepID=A0ABD5ZT27_9EURY